YLAISGKLRAITSAGGPKWQFAGGEELSQPCLAADGTILFGAKQTLFAVAADGLKKWTSKMTGSIVGQCVSSRGVIYVSCENGRLQAITRDGHPQWNFDAGGALSAPALAADDTIYLASVAGQLFALYPDA